MDKKAQRLAFSVQWTRLQARERLKKGRKVKREVCSRAVSGWRVAVYHQAGSRRYTRWLGRQVLAVCLLLVIPACTSPTAPPVAGAQAPASRQSIRIMLIPGDARCTVRQEADTFEAVADGDTLRVDRAAPLEMTCRRAGVRTLRLRKTPAFDFSMPAGQQMAYPDTITVELGK